MTIRPERTEDRPGIFAVHRRAFPSDAEARLVDRLREEGLVLSSLVAEQGGEVVGHVLMSRLTVQGPEGVQDGAALAPVAVVPEQQRRGIGGALIEAAVAACREQGERFILVVGDPAYYPRFGFDAKLARTLESPYSGDAFMAMELVPGSLRGGTVSYPAPFEEV